MWRGGHPGHGGEQARVCQVSLDFCMAVLDQELTGLRARLKVEYRTTKRIQEQYTVFVEGFNELNPQDPINVFDKRELEHFIGGYS
jgi:hypothetical protein